MPAVLRKPPDAELWRTAHAGEDVHEMDGVAFENLVSVALSAYGYHVEMTEHFDRGADIVATRNGRRTSIQVKRASRSVSETAIAQAVRGMAAYDCAAAMVITNSVFTPEARRQAEGQGVVLWDHEDLANLLHTTGIAPLTSACAPRCSRCQTTMTYAPWPRSSWRCDGCRLSAPYRRWALRVTAPSREAPTFVPPDATVPPPPPPSPQLPSAPASARWQTELKHGLALAAVAFGWMCVLGTALAMLTNQTPTQSTQRAVASALVLALLGIPTLAGTRSLRAARRRLRRAVATGPALP
jgi:hypothetical protein